MNEEKVVYHNGEEIIVKLGEYNHLLGKYFASGMVQEVSRKYCILSAPRQE